MIIYKFSVFKQDWLVSLLDTETKQESLIINNVKALTKFYNEFKRTIWVGYNSTSYDKYILASILGGYNPYDMSDFIIRQQKQGWEFSDKLKDFSINNYDTKINNHSLKTIVGFMGHDIRESSVPFNLKRKLTDQELLDVAKHLRYDVQQIFLVFMETLDTFNAKLALINQFKLHLKHISKSMAQLGAEILKARKINKDDEYDIWAPFDAELGKYDEVLTFFNRRRVLDADLTINIAGVENKIGKGGIHGALKNYHTQAKSDEYIILLDVNQLYPTLLLKYDLLSRGARFKSKYEWSLDESLRLKELGHHAARLPYKEFCNIVYGASGDRFNKLYDPRNRLLTCIFGQCFIVDLIDKLEPIIELIQSNTDGILVKIKRKDFDQLDDIVFEWEERTGLTMSFEYYDRVHQKDVNNYILIGERVTAVGQYTKDLSIIDNDLPIVNQAVKNYFIHGISVEDTINHAENLIDFQRVIRITDKFDGAKYGREVRNEKTFRVFSNTNGLNLSYLKNGKTSKIPHTPDAVTLVNEDVTELSIPDWLDKTWYIDLANKRVDDFIGNEKQKELYVENISLF